MGESAGERGDRYRVTGGVEEVVVKKFVYMATKGASDPTLASIPIHMAVNGSVEVGHDTSIVLAGDAAEIVLEDNLQKIEGVGVPPLRDLMAKAREHDVPIYV